MGSRWRAQSPSSVNKTSQWQLACVFRHAHSAPRCGYKRRARANAHQFFAEEPRLCAPAVQRWYSNYGDGTLPATRGNWYATAAGALSRAPRLRARCTWPPSPWQRRLLKQQHAWILALGELLPEERQGPTMGWRCDGRTGWVRPGMCRGAMPISGLGRGANAEAVSYEAIRAAW